MRPSNTQTFQPPVPAGGFSLGTSLSDGGGMTLTENHLREQLRSLVNRKAGIGEIDLARFKQLRVRLGLTQSELAGLIPVDRTALTAWERGTKNPSPEHTKRLAVLLDEMERLAGEARR